MIKNEYTSTFSEVEEYIRLKYQTKKIKTAVTAYETIDEYLARNGEIRIITEEEKNAMIEEDYRNPFLLGGKVRFKDFYGKYWTGHNNMRGLKNKF